MDMSMSDHVRVYTYIINKCICIMSTIHFSVCLFIYVYTCTTPCPMTCRGTVLLVRYWLQCAIRPVIRLIQAVLFFSKGPPSYYKHFDIPGQQLVSLLGNFLMQCREVC